MKYALPALLLVLAGCEMERPPTIQPAQGGSDLDRYGPDEFGVVCYRKPGWEGISCVKVKEQP